MKKIQKTIERNLTTFLVLIPILNVCMIWIFVTIHWVTGKFGYLFSSLFVGLGLIIVYLLVLIFKRVEFNRRTILHVFFSLFLLYIVYTDIKIFAETLGNNGLIPCPYGPSCP